MDAYLQGLISTQTFCDEFYIAYDINEFDIHLDDVEEKAFDELSEVSSHWNEELYKESGFLYSKKEVKAKVLETQKKLNAQGYGNGITFVMENQSDE